MHHCPWLQKTIESLARQPGDSSWFVLEPTCTPYTDEQKLHRTPVTRCHKRKLYAAFFKCFLHPSKWIWRRDQRINLWLWRLHSGLDQVNSWSSWWLSNAHVDVCKNVQSAVQHPSGMMLVIFYESMNNKQLTWHDVIEANDLRCLAGVLHD